MFLVAIYLALNLTVVAVGFYEIVTHPTVLSGTGSVFFFRPTEVRFLMIGTALVALSQAGAWLIGI